VSLREVRWTLREVQRALKRVRCVLRRVQSARTQVQHRQRPGADAVPNPEQLRKMSTDSDHAQRWLASL